MGNKLLGLGDSCVYHFHHLSYPFSSPDWMMTVDFGQDPVVGVVACLAVLVVWRCILRRWI